MSWVTLLVVAVAVGAPGGRRTPTSSPASIADAKRQMGVLEYESALETLQAVLARPSLSRDERLLALFLTGVGLVVTGRPLEAETPFRLVLDSEPDFEPPPDTPPDALGTFRRIQAEVRRAARQRRALYLATVRESLAYDSRVPDEPVGGRPLAVRYVLRDPTAAVGSMSLWYKPRGQLRYSNLPFDRVGVGEWATEIPASVTENEEGLELEYYVSADTARGDRIVTFGSAEAPHRIAVAPGTIAGATPIYERTWFWIAVGVVVIGAGVTTAVVVNEARSLPQGDIQYSVD